ncbi:MAG TPA: wax ester/triacylglycerol synthase domain-containing protein [Acidimicrobiales bacterium]|nr:wax ester/triacylglycerol synthase domain-containing protein [Acidimicrobiales bacterium]
MAASTPVPGSVALTPEDLAILAKESETVVGHVGKVIVVGPTLDIDDFRSSIERRIGDLPSLLRRLGGPADAPAWVPDPAFRLDDHVVATSTPGPTLTTADLNREIAQLFAQPLDRRRPLWRIDVLGPLEDGSQVLLWRIHHAMADGQTAVRFAAALFWDAAPAPAPSASPRNRASKTAELHHHRHRGHLAGFIEREFRRQSGPSPFDGQIGSQRSVAFADVELGPLRRSARAIAGATVNDAVLACVTGGLRRWLMEGNGSLGELRVKVPVSMHLASDTLGNRDSFFYLGLPLGEPDPATRLRLIRQESVLRKTHHDAEEMDRALAALSRVSSRLRQVCDRFQMDPREFALNVSNVPGPSRPVSILGRPVLSIHDIADIAERHALRVAAVSYGDHLGFGLCADAGLIDDLPGLAAAIQAEADGLIALGPP